MKFKFTILFILTTFLGFSQDLENLKKEVQKIYDLTVEKKFDIVFESTYPKVFDIVSKEEMKAAMNNLLDNEEMTITIEKVNPEFIFQEIIILDSGRYCIVEHNNKMTMKFKHELGESKEFILEYMKETMSGDNVTIDEKTETITVDGKAKIIAISDKLTKGTWKFLNYDGDTPMMEKVLGKEILEKLGL